MANEQDQENNGVKTQEETWRPTDEAVEGGGEAQKPFGEDQDPADGQGDPGDSGQRGQPTEQPWSPGQDEPPIITRDKTDVDNGDDDGRHPIKIF